MSEMLKCEHCHKEFRKLRKTARFCSPECNSKQWYIDYKERGGLPKFKVEKPKRSRKKKEIPIANCIVCGGEFRKTREDKKTCSRACANRVYYLKKSGKLKTDWVTKNWSFNNDIAKTIEPYLLDWKRRRFMLNEIDLFRAIDLWDMIYPQRFISDGADRVELFEGMITDIILYYKKNKKVDDLSAVDN